MDVVGSSPRHAQLNAAQVSTLELFKSILANQKSLPKEQPYKDLVTLINYILRQFFKAVEEDSFVLVEVTSKPFAQTAAT